MKPKQPEGQPDWPRNSYEFMRLGGVEANEGVVVAVFQPEITRLGVAGEHFALSQWVNVQAILGEISGLGTRLIDLLPDPVQTKIKWWKVRDFAREHGYNLIPEQWNGPASDIPEKYFAEGMYTGIRLYGAGPWVWPVLRPEMVLEEDTDEAKLKAIAEDYQL